MKKRDKKDITFDILKTIHNTPNNLIKITHIIYRANLTHTKLKKYLADLIKEGIVEEKEIKGKKYYSLTDNGFKYFYKLEELREFMKRFEV